MSNVNVGYYEMSAGEGQDYQVSEIELAGFNPLKINDLSAAELASIDILNVYNADRFGYANEYLLNLENIADAVRGGMILIIHDSHLDSAASILPGSEGFAIFHDNGDSGATDEAVDFLDDNHPVTNGPGGPLDDQSLDTSSFSSFGFAVPSSLPAAADLILGRNSEQILTFAYCVGEGGVIFSSIALDRASRDPDADPEFASFEPYAANLLAYAAGDAFPLSAPPEPGEPPGDIDFFLVNAETDEMVGIGNPPSLGGEVDTLNPNAFNFEKFDIRAILERGVEAQSLVFHLTGGSVEITKTENLEPYAIFGDRDGNFTGGAWLPDGTYNLSAQSFSAANGRGDVVAAGETTFVVERAPANSPPIVVDDGYAVTGGTTLSADVLANDRDRDGDPLAATLAYDVRHGTLALNGDGSFAYAPAPGFIGIDGFKYEVSDGITRPTGPERGNVTLSLEGSTPSPPSDIRLFVVDAATDTVLRELLPGDTIDPAEFPEATFAVLAEVADGVGEASLVFHVDGVAVKTENLVPYALFGDRGGDFKGGPLFPDGPHTVSATAFSGANGTGAALATVEIGFIVGTPQDIEALFANFADGDGDGALPPFDEDGLPGIEPASPLSDLLGEIIA